MTFRRGTLYLVMAWSVFMGTSSLLYIGMARLLGPERFGVFGLIFSVLYWLEIVLMYGVPYTVQKYVASHETEGTDILWTSLCFQTAISGLLFLLAIFLTPQIGSIFHKTDQITTLRIAFSELLFLGIFYLCMSYENGRKHFLQQAILFGGWSLLRAGFMFLAYLIFHTLEAVFVGNALATSCCMLVALAWLKPTPRPFHRKSREMIRFTTFSTLYFLLLNLFFFVDLWVVQHRLGDAAEGFYVAASMIAKIPYFLFFGFSMTMLPVISTALREDRAEAHSVIREGIYMLVLFALPIAALLSGLARGTIRLFFSNRYSVSSEILTILVWGMAGLALLALLTTILNADERIHRSVQILAGIITLDFVLNLVLVPRFDVKGGAISTTVSVLSGLLVSGAWVRKRFGSFLKFPTFVRMAVAALVVLGLISFIPQPGMAVIPIFLFGMSLYGVILYLLGEKEPFKRVFFRLKQEQ
jgi:stage V sporulation protein B